jgi:fatty acid synthase subunit alpha
LVDIPKQPVSALFAAAAKGNASIFALFGSQGTNEVYFDELKSLYDTYAPFMSEFLTTVTTTVLSPLADSQQSTPFYTYGMDVVSWLSGASSRPSTAYLASVPIAFPLIGLTQLIQYLVVCRVSGFTPGELRDRIAGATGHSQGIVSAVAIASSTTFESFTENSLKAIKWLFFSGLRGQQAFPVTSLEPSIVQDAISGGEGNPSPMLSVTGLSLKDLSPHITKTNSHLPSNSQLHVSLHNGPRAFVICGPAHALYGLVTNLRKIRAASGADQSKVPFSQRKPVFSVRFLVVGVPYHSEYLGGVTEMVMSDLEGVELWQGTYLGVGVYNTEDGEFFSVAFVGY